MTMRPFTAWIVAKFLDNNLDAVENLNNIFGKNKPELQSLDERK